MRHSPLKKKENYYSFSEYIPPARRFPEKFPYVPAAWGSFQGIFIPLFLFVSQRIGLLLIHLLSFYLYSD